MKYLRILAMEFYTWWLTSIRYPLDSLSSLAVLYIIYIGLFLGGKVILGGPAVRSAIETSIIGYTMWFLGIAALSTMSRNVAAEAQKGSLEQLFVAAVPVRDILLLRGLGSTLGAFVMAFIICLLLSVTTGSRVPLGVGSLPALMLTLCGMWGFGLCLGGITLLSKQTDQFVNLLQLLLLPAALKTDIGWLQWFPLARGVSVAVAAFRQSPAATNGLWGLGLCAALWLIVGALVFDRCVLRAKSGGTLGHY